MQNIEEKRLPDARAPFLQPLGMAGGIEAPLLAEKGQKMLRRAARAANPGEPAARIAAVKIALDDVLDNRTEIAVRLLESALVFRDEALEMMEEDSVEDGLLRMTGAINPCHGRIEKSRIEPLS